MFKKIIKTLVAILCLMSLLGVSACSKQENSKDKVKYSSVDEFHNVKFGIDTGSILDEFLRENYPDCEIVYFASPADRYLAVEEGKVTAYWTDGPKVKSIVKQKDDLYYLSDENFTSPLAFAFSKNSKGEKLQSQMNIFLAKLEEDGTLDTLVDKWIESLAIDTVSDDDLKNINGEINVTINSNNQPLLFVANNGYAGIEYDILVRFCREYGYSLNINDTTLDGTIASVSSEKSEIGASGLTITEERKESLLFSTPYYVADGKCIMLKENLDVEIDPLDYLQGKNIGVLSGTMHIDVVNRYLPQSNISYYNSTADLFTAVSQGKVDAIVDDDSIAKLYLNEFDNLYVAKVVDTQDYACLIAKTSFGDVITKELSEYIVNLNNSGELEKIREYWFEDIKYKEFDYDALSGENGTLRVGYLQDAIPFSYISNNESVGYEIELLYNFAKEYGYKVEFMPLTFDAEIAYLTTDKADVCLGGFVVTPERKEQFNFSETIYVGGNSFVMANDTVKEKTSFVDYIINGINKTFIEEDRYLLFIDGIKSTTFITLASVIFGTIIGIVLFALFRLNNNVINTVLNGLSWIIKSTPIVVLLMILYYIIFGKSSISGFWVSVFAFSLIFAITVLGIFKTCFMAIDIGQYEASYALGYSKYQTFFKIILPQMMPMFIPSYSSEIIALIKSTSIVGYIAVQDLTKVSDVVRSRTFDAFFPLISTTIIYFAIMFMFATILSIVAKKIDPQRRKKEDILKGVKTHD